MPGGSIPADRSTWRSLRAAGLVSKRRDGIRLLARGELTAPLTIEVDSASQAAAEAVAKAGGKLILPAPKPEAPKPKPKAKPKAKTAKAKAPEAEESAAEQPASE